MKIMLWYNKSRNKKASATDGKDCVAAAPAVYRVGTEVICADRLGMSYFTR